MFALGQMPSTWTHSIAGNAPSCTGRVCWASGRRQASYCTLGREELRKDNQTEGEVRFGDVDKLEFDTKSMPADRGSWEQATQDSSWPVTEASVRAACVPAPPSFCPGQLEELKP